MAIDAVPDRIGPYELYEVLGEGGMVVTRFRSERQALAVMDHTSIAKVLDAGSTESGRPYFVMELVRGEALDTYCDKHRLPTRQRIELFIRVCEAVHHAHQKGVVHRDLKPSNVLVSVEGRQPLPKVIDFGIAKAIGAGASASGLVTTMGQMLGTPAYMSPEQAETGWLDVDTRTDVYSLGVILYELLTGSLPFDRSTFQKPDLVVQYLLREREVPTPSVRLGDLADTQKTVAHKRRTDVRTLRREEQDRYRTNPRRRCPGNTLADQATMSRLSSLR
jgi:serine/threonine protein kinase